MHLINYLEILIIKRIKYLDHKYSDLKIKMTGIQSILKQKEVKEEIIKNLCNKNSVILILHTDQ